MAKLKLLLAVFFLLTQYCGAQGYLLRYQPADSASAQRLPALSLQTGFSSRLEASGYVASLPKFLQSKGYVTASLDSVSLDSTAGMVQLFLGEPYHWAQVRVPASLLPLMESIRWNEGLFKKGMDMETLRQWQQKVLDYLEEHGHPFGKVYLDSIEINADAITALLRVDQGPLYKIDSIRVYGDVRISSEFLQRYLDIPNGSPYNRKKLEAISRKIADLPFLQEEKPSDLSLLGTGSVLNLHLKSKRTSQVNALIGFLPNSDQDGEQKLLLTVDVNLLFRNALANGETIGVVWQQLQRSSPKLNLLYEQPYIFHSPFGLAFSLEMYKRDSSFLNLNINLGTTYRINEKQSGSLFLQRRQTIVSSVNTARVIQTRQLPPEADVSSINLGASYSYSNTNYRFNPRSGNEWTITGTAGTKTVKKNSQVLELEDPADPGFKFEKLYDTVKLNVYQFRITTAAAHYFPVGRQSTVKLGFNGGLFQSANYFRNELFQIGGFRLLRGFDEESQFVSHYAIGTLEYRYLFGNSAFFAFLDGGYGRHMREAILDHTYLGTGLGLSFETKAGIINIAWAVGSRDDLEMNLRQSKLHIGFASYF